MLILPIIYIVYTPHQSADKKRFPEDRIWAKNRCILDEFLGGNHYFKSQEKVIWPPRIQLQMLCCANFKQKKEKTKNSKKKQQQHIETLLI